MSTRFHMVLLVLALMASACQTSAMHEVEHDGRDASVDAGAIAGTMAGTSMLDETSARSSSAAASRTTSDIPSENVPRESGDAGAIAMNVAPQGAPSPLAVEDALRMETRSQAGVGATRCGKRTICVPKTSDPAQACEAALALMLVEERVIAPASCALLQRATSAAKGALRDAALLEISYPDLSKPLVIALAGEDGFDRVVDFVDAGEGINQTLSVGFRRFALEDMVPGGSFELHVEVESTSHASSCVGEVSWVSKRRALGVCGLDGEGNAFCTPPIPRMMHEVESESRGDRITRHVTRSYSLSVRVRGDMLVVRQASGQLPRELKPVLGRHPLPLLTRLPAELSYL